MNKLQILKQINFGQRIAEEEVEKLSNYFVETHYWDKVFNGEVDIVYGAKGSGKSAIYSYLNQKEYELLNKGILIVSAENPRGATVFKDLIDNPPPTEKDFIRLWKLYFVIIIAGVFKASGFKDESTKKLNDILEKSNLLPPQNNLKAILKTVSDYIKSIESISPGIEFDSSTGLPRLNCKITFHQPSKQEILDGIMSIEEIFELINKTLEINNFKLWIIIDRLDVAFADSLEMEANALRALFKAYIDLFPYDMVKIKIFLRDDIWQRIIKEGFREASHITKTLTIKWNKDNLLNLIIKRLLDNNVLVEHYNINKGDIFSSFEKQDSLFYRFFPTKVETGSRKSKTYDWILSRIRDGKGIESPRELIHLLNIAKDVQIKKLEIGNSEPSADILIDKVALKESLHEVSKVRIEQTIYAEYPNNKALIDSLKSEKSEHTYDTLKQMWKTDKQETEANIATLVDIGLFQERGEKTNQSYWIPFIYRPALGIIQGMAEIENEEEDMYFD